MNECGDLPFVVSGHGEVRRSADIPASDMWNTDGGDYNMDSTNLNDIFPETFLQGSTNLDDFFSLPMADENFDCSSTQQVDVPENAFFGSTGQICPSNSNTINLLEDVAYDQDIKNTISFNALHEFISPKQEDVDVTSPPHSFTSDLWDSGVSVDDCSTTAMQIDQRLSPLSDYTPRGATPASELTTPQLSPTSSSGYNSSSPSSSPTSSLNSSPSASPTNSPLSPSSGGLYSPTTLAPAATVPQQPATQFYTHKRPATYKCTTINSSTNTKTPVNGVSAPGGLHPLTVVSSTPIVSHTIPYTCKIPPTIINRSLVNMPAKQYQQKSSPSPAIVTLSGVNKTAGGIIKSPSVLSANRKQTFINNNNNVKSNIVNNNSNNNISIVNSVVGTGLVTSGCVVNSIGCQRPSSGVLSSTELTPSNSSMPVYKTVTVSSTGRFTTSNGQQIIIAKKPTNSNLKSLPKKSLLIPINSKDVEKLHTIKIIASRSNSLSTCNTISSNNGTILRTANGLHTFMSANSRHRIKGVTGATAVSSSACGLRPANVSILKNISLPAGKTLHRIKSGLSGLVTIPKEENVTSDDEFEMPKNNQPLVLTDEEKKIALKDDKKFPSHYPLNPKQERELRGIKRKIRNKISAQESRKRKKEYLDKLEDKLNIKCQEMDKYKTDHDQMRGERDRLKLQIGNKDETIKKLSEQLKKFQNLMNSHHTASVSHTSNSSNSHNTRQQHPSTFLLMMILSVALFIYPSVVPQGKTATELLTAVSNKMPPAGNTRSLLEAAKLSVCPEDSFVDDDLHLDNKASIAALTDHDYTPPAKRARFSIDTVDENYCTAPITFDEAIHDKPKLGNVGDVIWLDGGGSTPEHPTSPIPNMKSKSSSLTLDQMGEVDLRPIKVDPEISTEKFSQDAIDSMMSRLQSNHNWTQPGREKVALDSLAKSLIVDLAATAGIKRFREDTELE